MGCLWAGSNGEKWSNIAKYFILGRFWPFFTVFAWEWATSLPHLCFYFTKNVITGCWCNDIYNAKVTPGYYHSIFLTFARKLNFWSFLAIFSPFVPTYGWPLYHISTFIDKSVITGCCCNNIYRERATQGYLSPHVPTICLKIKFFGHFWPFFIMCACFLPFSLLRICLYWQKSFHWVLLQWYL